MMIYLNILQIVLAGVGLYIALVVGRSKRTGNALVCSIEHDCDSVVNSAFGKTFGIENTVLGALYYAGIGIGYAIVVLFGDFAIAGVAWSLLLLGASLGAALFSLYLVSIMAFKLKQWCDWCLGSATVSWLIAAGSVLMYFLG